MKDVETIAARARVEMKTAENQLVLAADAAKAATDRAKEARAKLKQAKRDAKKADKSLRKSKRAATDARKAYEKSAARAERAVHLGGLRPHPSRRVTPRPSRAFVIGSGDDEAERMGVRNNSFPTGTICSAPHRRARSTRAVLIDRRRAGRVSTKPLIASTSMHSRPRRRSHPRC